MYWYHLQLKRKDVLHMYLIAQQRMIDSFIHERRGKMNTEKTSGKKMIYLDGIRGLAAFIVVISHYIQVFYPAALNGNQQQAHFKWDIWYGHSPINLFYNGQLAVCLFFVLSGYVLSVKMFEKELDNETFQKLLHSSALRRVHSACRAGSGIRIASVSSNYNECLSSPRNLGNYLDGYENELLRLRYKYIYRY